MNTLPLKSYKIEIENRIKNKGLTLIWIENGIAYRIADKVYLNNNLPKYKDYCEEVIHHELSHSNNWHKGDLILDILDGDVIKNLKFMFRHPKAFKQMLPFGIIEGKIFVDINLLLIYSIVAFLLIATFFIVT